MKNILGFDFSIKKPAACLLNNGKYSFYSWPNGLTQKINSVYLDSGISIFPRGNSIDEKKDISDMMNFQIADSENLANLIVSSFSDLDPHNTILVFEGLSFSSAGNVILQLGGYKFILMKAFKDAGFQLQNTFTYSPMTIKKVAGCSKKGMGKKDMIDAFINNTSDKNIPFRDYIKSNDILFRKKTGNWIDHLDDLIDSFWVVETHMEKISP